MTPDQLPPGIRSKFDELLQAIEEILSAQKKGPQTQALSYAWMDAEIAITGGDLSPPKDPGFDYDRRALTQRFKAVLKPALDLLRGIIVHASRPNAEAKWQLHTKIISRADQRALESARKPIDDAVERELRKLAPKSGWEYFSFGRDKAGGSLRAFMKLKDVKPQQIEAPLGLADLYTRVEDVYRKADLTLVIGDWTLQPASFDFREYYE